MLDTKMLETSPDAHLETSSDTNLDTQQDTQLDKSPVDDNVQIEDFIHKVKESINIISTVFEIRLNVTKPQDMFENPDLITFIKSIVTLLDNMEINIFEFKMDNTDVINYIYKVNNTFYNFYHGHYNLNLIIDEKHYVCKIINEYPYYDNMKDTIVLECRNQADYDQSLEIKTLNLNEFISKLQYIESYETHILDIFKN